MSLADASLQALFPVTLVLGGVSYAATGVGGSALSDYLAGGGGSAPDSWNPAQTPPLSLAQPPQ